MNLKLIINLKRESTFARNQASFHILANILLTTAGPSPIRV